MQYRLLRNNKESGPYTKAQLEEMGLKPYDLLWIEGRGGAWLYASEIDDLKSIAPAIEEQPYDRFYKGKEKQTAITNSKQNNSSNANTTNTTNTATLKQPKPRFRISGDKVVMIDNAALQEPKPLHDALSSFTKTQPQQPEAVAAKAAPKQEIATHIQSVGLDWEDMYTDWKGEAKEKTEKPAPAKAQTMEEVRQRFEEAKLKQLGEKQHKTANNTKQNIMAAVAILVLAIGGYAGYKMNQGSDSNSATQSTPAVEKAVILQNGNNQQQDPADANSNVSASAQQQTDDNTSEVANEVKNSLPADNSKTVNPAPLSAENNKENNPDTKKEQSQIPAKNTEANTTVKTDKKAVQQEPVTDNNKVTAGKNTQEDYTPYDIKKGTATAPIQAPPVTEPAIAKQEASKKSISDYISVSRLGSNTNSGSVQNVLLSVKNVTDFPIDLAVVDIQYYGTNGRFQKGETMYVRNIGAGDNINVRIPDSKTSRSISYKVSLVSSEQKTLYLVGD
ncbi:hypothetical protein FC093_18095 [Ilyomonas limi]|uniref:DUF4339 domain-containing protein n=1 Tax=Ilyomonas limi TaxID=2575867 RepID=A0A4U3KWW5_9BACT|nr:DUF4339 domain-containing protein [Ilyomonas limi]TKK66164.1 hypothetical protein FC093_18095 [Ilyomonas limi]